VFVRLRRMSAVSSEHAWMEADCGW
jgi:hypothetical protein